MNLMSFKQNILSIGWTCGAAPIKVVAKMDNKEDCGSLAQCAKNIAGFIICLILFVAFVILFFAGTIEWFLIIRLSAISGFTIKEVLLDFLSSTTIWGKLALATPPLFIIENFVESWIRLFRKDRQKEKQIDNRKENEPDGEK